MRFNCILNRNSMYKLVLNRNARLHEYNGLSVQWTSLVTDLFTSRLTANVLFNESLNVMVKDITDSFVISLTLTFVISRMHCNEFVEFDAIFDR